MLGCMCEHDWQQDQVVLNRPQYIRHYCIKVRSSSSDTKEKLTVYLWEILVRNIKQSPKHTELHIKACPSNHSWPSPDAESHVAQMECHMFSLYSCWVNPASMFLLQSSIPSFAASLKIRKSFSADGVAREKRTWSLQRSVNNLLA